MKVIKITKQFCSQAYDLFDPSNLSVGDVTESDIFIKKSSEYVMIIEANTKLTEKLYNLLIKNEKLFVRATGSKIEDTDIPCSKLGHHIKMSDYSLKESIEKIYMINNDLFQKFMKSDENKIELECVESIVTTLIYLLKHNKTFLKEVKPNLYNNYDVDVHSLNVSIYALHIGYMIGISDKQLLQLGTAAILHDLGKKLILDTVNKKTPLEMYELENIKKHSLYSVDIAKQNDITDKVILDAILQHHERNDGSGYPYGLGEKSISYFASILAVSDVFDALTVDRPYRDHYSSFESLKILMKNALSEGTFNEEYIKLLLV